MIHVDRSRIKPPEILQTKGKLEKQRAITFFSEGKQQKRFIFTVYSHPEVKKALNELFYGKCAFCEQKIIVPSSGDIEHFRPKSGVVESPDHPGYYWLAAEWANLYIACLECNRASMSEGGLIGKGNRFPISDEAKRAMSPDDDISAEDPLLLDPCNDFPEEHLVFTEDGLVHSETRKGKTTIALFGLNRWGLVEARRKKAAAVEREFLAVAQTLVKDPQDDNKALAKLQAITQDDHEFAAFSRQLVGIYFQRLGIDSDFRELSPEERENVQKIKGVAVTYTTKQQRQAKESNESYLRELESYSLDTPAGIEVYRRVPRPIKKIVITNVKAIGKMVIDIKATEKGGSPWFMFLGENATGKSTILQVIAMTLLGRPYLEKLIREIKLNPRDFMRITKYRGDVKRLPGVVKVHANGFTKPHQLTFGDDFIEFKSPLGTTSRLTIKNEEITKSGDDWWPVQFVLLGYGATRLLPLDSATDEKDKNYARVTNLFNPYFPLHNIKRWLLELNDTDFIEVALVLKDLLQLENQDELIRENGEISITLNGTTVPLEQLSAGYQSVIATTGDILEVAHRIWGNFEQVEGIVLIDEIGAHLHPRWQMRVISSLRKALKGMQFLCASHQPLCLRGLNDGEIALMKKNVRGRVSVVTELPSIEGLRVDQLLTSEHFGLHSTRSLEIEQKFNEYYVLISKPKLTEKETKRIAALQSELDEYHQFGTTRREKLMLEAIDRYLASENKYVGAGKSKSEMEALENTLDEILASIE